MVEKPEDEAREEIDRMLRDAGWAVQDAAKANIHASRGVALRNFSLKPGHGFADYLLYVDGSAAGVVEAKKQGATLTGVEIQSAKYSEGLPTHLPARVRPLPFCYQSTGVETHFTNGLDPDPRSRPVFWFHRPETMADWFDDLLRLEPRAGHAGESPRRSAMRRSGKWRRRWWCDIVAATAHAGEERGHATDRSERRADLARPRSVVTGCEAHGIGQAHLGL